MQAPAFERADIYNSQNNTNKKIISACVAKIEKVYGPSTQPSITKELVAKSSKQN
jgi:hypothetical protein